MIPKSFHAFKNMLTFYPKVAFTIYGYPGKDNCAYCGKPLGPKYSFCPFREPMTNKCIRKLCNIRVWIYRRLGWVDFTMSVFSQLATIKLSFKVGR